MKESQRLEDRVKILESFVENLCISKLLDIEHDLEAVDEDILNCKEVEELEAERKDLLAAKKRYATALGPKTSHIVKQEVTSGKSRSSKRSRR